MWDQRQVKIALEKFSPKRLLQISLLGKMDFEAQCCKYVFVILIKQQDPADTLVYQIGVFGCVTSPVQELESWAHAI